MTAEQAQVKLDIDRDVYPDLDTVRRLLERAGYAIVHCSVRQSPSCTGWHVVVDISPRPQHPMEVVALQAICGSDPYRESMQMNRARGFAHAPTWMRSTWNVLYLPDPKRQRHVNLR